MNQIQFRGTNAAGQEFAKVVRKRVRNYFKENNCTVHGNTTMYIKTGVMLGLYLLPFIVLLFMPVPTLVAIGLLLLIGIGEAGIGMSVMHDAAHGSYSPNKRINEAVAASMYLLGSNTFNWKIQHNVMHHTFTNIFKHDPDIDTKAILRLCEHAPLKKYHSFQQFYGFVLYGLMTILRLVGDMPVLIAHNKSGRTAGQNANPKEELTKLVATKIVYVAVVFGLPLWLTDYNFWQVLLGFSIVHGVAGMIMGTVFQMAHVVEGVEQPLPIDSTDIESDWVMHEMQTTSNFGRKNGLLTWYIGGLDFQVEHHLFPNICHVHYPKIAPIVEATALEFGVPYNMKPTFRAALVSHYRRLKALGVERIVPINKPLPSEEVLIEILEVDTA